MLLTKIVEGLRPAERLEQPPRPELQVEAMLVGVSRDAAPAFREDFGVAVLAARAHVR